jgi:hypothetical protein
MNEVRKIAGENLSEAELTDLAERLLSRARRLRSERVGMTADEAVAKALAGMSEELLTESRLKKRATYLTQAAVAREIGGIEQNWADDPRKGLEVALVGSNIARRGAQRSIDADQKGLASELVNGFAADIERLGPGKYKMYARGDLDAQVYKALDQMYSPQPDFTSIDRDAREFAQIIFKYQEAVRTQKNNAGAWIAKLPDYITHQSHDMFKVRRASFEAGKNKGKGGLNRVRDFFSSDEAEHYKAWRDFITPLLDEEKTFGDMTPEQSERWIKHVWRNIASGEHLKSASMADGFPAHGSLANRMSQPRILHFKDADARFQYDTAFGRGGSLFERSMLQLQRSGHDIALMRRFGPNPHETFTRLKKGVRLLTEDSVAARDASKWSGDERILDAYFAELTGDAFTPGTDPFSTALRSSRVIATLSKLGSAVISSMTDTGIASSELQYHGISLGQSWKTQLDGLFQGRGKRGQERAEWMRQASEFGVAIDELRSAVWSRFSAEDAMPGWAARTQHFFFKANGLMWWTDTLRMANAQAISHNLALNATRPMPSLDVKLQRLLKSFDISAGEWDLMRGSATDVVNGKEYFSPKAATRITDVEIAQLLNDEGVKFTPRRIQERRNLLHTKFRDFISSRADYAIITPGPRTRTFMTGSRFGIAPGTPAAELMRSVSQFKSFPAAVIEKVWGREVFGYGESGAVRDVSKSGMGQLAQFIVYSTFLGFASMYMKAVFGGRTIRPPENGQEGTSMLLASFLQGGGAGIYGDFLFGQAKDRFGHSAFSSLLGPTFGSIEDLYGMARGAPGAIGSMTGLKDDDGKAAGAWAAHTFSTGLSHTPFINLFYTRMALDYAILYRLQEEISPGYLKRMEKRASEDRNQDFIFPPSESFGK